MSGKFVFCVAYYSFKRQSFQLFLPYTLHKILTVVLERVLRFMRLPTLITQKINYIIKRIFCLNKEKFILIYMFSEQLNTVADPEYLDSNLHGNFKNGLHSLDKKN